MRSVVLCAVCLLALAPSPVARAQVAAEEAPGEPRSSPGFPGSYLFEWEDGRSLAEVEVEDTTLRARVVTSGGYAFGLVGTAQGHSASGTIVGKSWTGDFGEFAASIEGDVLHLELTLRPAPDQEAQQLSLTFSRIAAGTSESAADEAVSAEASPAEPSPPAIAPATPTAGTVPAGAAGDAQLVGTWVYQSLITSGGDSFASEQFQLFAADGRWAYGRGSSAAGGAGWSYDGGSGEGVTERGFWRAEDGVLFLADANGEWKRLGKYGMTEDGSTMRITYNSGNKKLWSRR